MLDRNNPLGVVRSVENEKAPNMKTLTQYYLVFLFFLKRIQKYFYVK